MSLERPTRRRVITVLAATAAAGFSGGMPFPARAVGDHEWRGLAMGTDARLFFCGASVEEARAAVKIAVAEIERLERALSIFRSESEICSLNHNGVLAAPSGDMRRALALALAVAETTGGLFDPTVQALWEAYVDWFAAAPNAGLPATGIVAAARTLVDWRRISLGADEIRLGRGQRITLNGLGQGYVTDRVADLLRQRGFIHALVDLGEQRALGPRGDGAPWMIARTSAEPIALREGALATSEGSGCILGASGAAHHLFNPRTGRSAHRWRRMTVGHRSAAVADALSTALYVATPAEITAIVKKFTGIDIWATDNNGREKRWSSGEKP